MELTSRHQAELASQNQAMKSIQHLIVEISTGLVGLIINGLMFLASVLRKIFKSVRVNFENFDKKFAKIDCEND